MTCAMLGRLVMFLLCSASALPILAQPQIVPADARNFQGIWEMDGYALIMHVGPNEVVYYDVTTISCLESDRKPASNFAERFRGGVLRRSAAHAIVRDHVQPYTIKRLASLPQRCGNGGTSGVDPVLNFDVFIQYMKENYANSVQRRVDWDAIRAEFRPRVSPGISQEQLWDIYRQILSRLDDVHVFLTNGKQGSEGRSISAGQPSGLREALVAQNPQLTEDQGFDRDTEVSKALNTLILYEVLEGRYHTALNDKFQWGWVTPTIGYLNIKSMYQLFEKPTSDPALVDKAVADTMDKIMTDFSRAEAVVIDVRQNRGGADAVAQGIAARFADAPVTRRARAKSPEGYTEWFETTLVPKGSRFRKPVYVLISENTVSAAESFVIYMKEFPNVTLVGENTRGTLSDILFKKLPDGSFLGIANMQALDAQGRNLEVVGVAPDVRVASYQPNRLMTGYADAIRAALNLQAAKREVAR